MPISKLERYLCFRRRALQGIIVTPSLAASLSGDMTIRSQATNGGQNFKDEVGIDSIDVKFKAEEDSEANPLDSLSRDGL